MQTTLGCWRDAAACASRRNRLRRSSCRAMDSFITLMATHRSSTESVALYTTPIAPSPTSSMMWYLPISGILWSAMYGERLRRGRSVWPQYSARRPFRQSRATIWGQSRSLLSNRGKSLFDRAASLVKQSEWADLVHNAALILRRLQRSREGAIPLGQRWFRLKVDIHKPEL